jgi:Putative Tad-like Flp pilus-assembly
MVDIETMRSDPITSAQWRNKRYRGVAVIYWIVAMPLICGFCSLAVDFGYVELNKFQLQKIADASAHDYLVLLEQYGTQTLANSHISTTKNKIISINGSTPTVTATWGYWNTVTQTFSTSSSTGATVAVKVVASCSKANNNAVPLLFAAVLGQSSLNESATAVATDLGTSSTASISALSNMYLAGMPAGTTTVWGDTTSANGATQMNSIPVVPGEMITFTSISGTSSVTYPSMPYYGPNGSNGANGTAIQHGQNWDGSMYSANTENGIADAIMPDSAFAGMFLDNTEPDLSATPPSTVDWTQSSVANQNSFTNLAVKTPFFIGDGTNGSTVKTFQVPQGATRLFIGVWDGVEYSNNSGSLSATVNVQHEILIVQ